MKKVKDVFSLPVDASEVRFLSCHDRDPSLTENERLETAANAINHADALAEVLEAVLPFCQGRTKEQIDAWAAAKDTLAAYRGEA